MKEYQTFQEAFDDFNKEWDELVEAIKAAARKDFPTFASWLDRILS